MTMIRQMMLGLMCGVLTLSAAENLLYNGDLQHGVRGFRSVTTRDPEKQVDKVMQVVKDSEGKSVLRLRFSSETARFGMIIQPIPLAKLKGAKKLALSCRLRICPDNPADFQGSLFLRLRQWKQGKAKNKCGLWLPFSSQRGLLGHLDRTPDVRGLATEKPVQGAWHELMGSGILDEATNSLDFMMHGGVKTGAVTIEIMDLTVSPVQEASCKLVKRPVSATQGQASLPVTLKLSQAAEVSYALKQNGKLVHKGTKLLNAGEQALAVPLNRLKPGSFTLDLKADGWQDSLKLQLEEDPFGDF